MANVKITDLPLITGITINDVIPIVDVDTIVTSKVTIGDLKNYLETPFTGGTVSGDTEFTNGLTANTISATTYFNLPTDIYVTGGTYSNGDITFTNNTGGTFNVSGLFTGSTDVYVTGGTYNNNTFTYTNNIGGTFDVSFNSVSGLTSNGTIESNVISATTISGGTLYGDGSNLSGISQTPFYQESVWTSFQTSVRTVSSVNYGSGGAIVVPFYVNKTVTILNSKIECSLIAVNPTNCEFAIYDVISGTVTNRLFHQTFQVTGTGLFTFSTNLTLQPGIYAYATTQDIILGWRSFTLPNSVLGVNSNMGTDTFISAKTQASNNLLNPFGSQTNNNSNCPLAIFEIQI